LIAQLRPILRAALELASSTAYANGTGSRSTKLALRAADTLQDLKEHLGAVPWAVTGGTCNSPTVETLSLLRGVVDLARTKADGHLTIFRFTTGWKVALDTVTERDDIGALTQHSSLEEALRECLQHHK
jgi:hypothetical protein